MRQPSAGCGEAGLWRNTTGFSSSQEVKKNGSKRIKKIRAPSASFRGSTRCDQHGPLSCERAGLRLLFGSSWCACGAVRLALLLSDPRVLLASRMPLRGCAASTRFSRSPIRCPSPSEAHAVESGSWQVALVRYQGTCECSQGQTDQGVSDIRLRPSPHTTCIVVKHKNIGSDTRCLLLDLGATEQGIMTRGSVSEAAALGGLCRGVAGSFQRKKNKLRSLLALRVKLVD